MLSRKNYSDNWKEARSYRLRFTIFKAQKGINNKGELVKKLK